MGLVDNIAGIDDHDTDEIIQNNLDKREILSSAESFGANHFITKTRVGGTLKNTRKVIFPAGTGRKNQDPAIIQ